MKKLLMLFKTLLSLLWPSIAMSNDAIIVVKAEQIKCIVAANEFARQKISHWDYTDMSIELRGSICYAGLLGPDSEEKDYIKRINFVFVIDIENRNLLNFSPQR